MTDHSVSDMQKKIVNENLIEAVRNFDREKIELCLRKGADIDARWKDASNRTPLMLAACWGNENLVAFLLTRKPDLFATDAGGKTVYDILKENTDSASRKKISKMLIAALPDPADCGPEAPAEGPVEGTDRNIPVMKPLSFDRNKKPPASFKL